MNTINYALRVLLLKPALLLITVFFFFSQTYAQTGLRTDSLRVEGVCGSCEKRIETALKIKGIEDAQWNVTNKMLTVSYDPTVIALRQIHQKVAAVGHDTELEKASQEVYDALPECCLYKNPGNEGHSDDMADGQADVTRGVVLSVDNKGNFNPLTGASVVWNGGNSGVITDAHGVFTIPNDAQFTALVISYAGFQPDTIAVESKAPLQVVLAQNGQLEAITISAKNRTAYVNSLGVFRNMTINSKDLLKAACCNLSESFETNPSVDVSYNDGVTGSKQIQLLGLSGIYNQLMVENLPGPRGLATSLGLNSIAGPWIESIQISKGSGSVVNGYESITGQINVELKKPGNSERLYVNGYVNDMGRTDVNVNLAQAINNKWSVGLLLHDDFLYNKTDVNRDGFRDLPTGNLFSAVNRWHYDDGKGVTAQFGVKILADRKTGGEVKYDAAQKESMDHYGLGIDIDRYEAFAKLGYIFPAKRYQSIGLQVSAFDHTQHSYFGRTNYDARQKNIFANLIYQSIIGNSNHKFRTGMSVVSDQYRENYKSKDYDRTETVPGAFFEYIYKASEKLSAVAGLRADHYNIYGWFATPRLNVRYAPNTNTVIRLNGGRGWRTANIFAENMSALVSAREVKIISNGDRNAYGLKPEIAWNMGISVDQTLQLFDRKALLSLDLFRTDFVDQVIADVETPGKLLFYNLDGKSYSNSLQAEFNVKPLKQLDVRVAYRWFDVKTTYGDVLKTKPFAAQHRAFANAGYTLGAWKFDYTVNYISDKRIPSTEGSPMQYRMPERSPAYFTMNAQVSKTFGKKKKFDLYIGGENLTNYFQKQVIIAADNPFDEHFDASMIWGPASGRLIYAGFRFGIK